MDAITLPGTSSGNLFDKLAIGAVAPRAVPEYWDRVEPMLVEGKKYWETYYELRDIAECLMCGTMQLWLAVERDTEEVFLTCLTQINSYPQISVFNILWMTGKELIFVLPAVELMELWARRNGCNRVEIVAHRRGWEKILKPYDYRVTARLLVKDLSQVWEN